MAAPSAGYSLSTSDIDNLSSGADGGNIRLGDFNVNSANKMLTIGLAIAAAVGIGYLMTRRGK